MRARRARLPGRKLVELHQKREGLKDFREGCQLDGLTGGLEMGRAAHARLAARLSARLDLCHRAA